MSNKKEGKIFNDAPNGATNVDFMGAYLKETETHVEIWREEDGVWEELEGITVIRSLKDIKEITELKRERDSLKFANREAKEYIESELGSVFITICPKKPFNPKEHREKRDLEQQRNILEELQSRINSKKELGLNGSFTAANTITAQYLRRIEKQLRQYEGDNL